MSSLHGLPPLPKSFSALVEQRQQHWRRHSADTVTSPEPSYSNVSTSSSPRGTPSGSSGRPLLPAVSPAGRSASSSPCSAGGRPALSSPLQQQLARLRRDMALLRQLDIHLLYQLLALNESIQQYKQAADEEDEQNFYYNTVPLAAVSEGYSASSSSSMEFGDV